MTLDILFYIAFFGQIVLISFIMPRKIDKAAHYVLNNFPAENYPKLYPMPYENYEKQYKYFVLLCRAVLIIGVVLLGLFVSGVFGSDMQRAVPLGYFFVQYLPLIMIEISSRKHLKLMRNDEARTTRKAVLQPRRFIDFVPPRIGIAAIFLYISFAILAIFVELFDTGTSNGFSNLAIITLADIFFLGIIFWNLYGKNQDPYRSNETRLEQIRSLTKSLFLINIAATSFAFLTLLVNFLSIEVAESISLVCYLQLVALLGMPSLKFDHVDFDVYKKDEAVI